MGKCAGHHSQFFYVSERAKLDKGLRLLLQTAQ
jgi:hypothetical protein